MCGAQTTQKSSQAKDYFIQYKSQGWNTTLILNGIPIKRIRASSGVASISDWTKEGANQVQVVAEIIPSRFANPPLRLEIISSTVSGEARAEIDPLLVERVEGQARVSKIASFESVSKPKQLWEKAEPIGRLSAEDESELWSIFNKLGTAAKARDVQQILDLYTTAMAFKSQATGVDLTTVQRENRELYQHALAIGGSVEVAETQQLQLFPGERGVLLCPEDSTSLQYLIKISDRQNDGQSYEWEQLVFCKINSRWAILE